MTGMLIPLSIGGQKYIKKVVPVEPKSLYKKFIPKTSIEHQYAFVLNLPRGRYESNYEKDEYGFMKGSLLPRGVELQVLFRLRAGPIVEVERILDDILKKSGADTRIFPLKRNII
jgi:hypothetical protein